MFNAELCSNITGKFRRSFSSPPLDDRSATIPSGCCSFYFQVKTDNSQLHTPPSFGVAPCTQQTRRQGGHQAGPAELHFRLVMTPAKGDGPLPTPALEPNDSHHQLLSVPSISESISAKAPTLPNKERKEGSMPDTRKALGQLPAPGLAPKKSSGSHRGGVPSPGCSALLVLLHKRENRCRSREK